MSRPLYPTTERRGWNVPDIDPDFIPPPEPEGQSMLTGAELDAMPVDAVIDYFHEMNDRDLIEAIDDAVANKMSRIPYRIATMELLSRFQTPALRKPKKSA
jgi:hypothetical protein